MQIERVAQRPMHGGRDQDEAERAQSERLQDLAPTGSVLV
jgi:hypothetical protein